MTKRLTILSLYLLTIYSLPAQPATDLNFRYKEITMPRLMQKLQKGHNDFIILDVRTKGEFHDTLSGGKHLNIGHIKGAINIPLQDLQRNPEALQPLEPYKNKDIYVICSHSYRSRTISKLLLEKNFANITNVQGGMSEWFRNYDELKPYADKFYEESISYTNVSPSGLFQKLKANEPVEFIGFSNTPRFFFDSVIATLFQYFPDFKNVSYFKPADSLQVLEKVKAANGKPIVLFNTVGGGAAETADWLSQKGISNVNYLIGNLTGFYEYLVNYQESSDVKKYLAPKSNIQFFTPLSFCKTRLPFLQWVDLRHDTLFNKITNGTRLSYKTITDAVNFPFYKTADDFVNQFRDKTRLYLFIPQQGYIGLELAAELVKRGYMIDWLIGGIERWEWYTNNVEVFTCKDYLSK
jgi:rhodanese-related sulfurtransferase